MIQRIQSLYLLGAFLVSMGLYYFPILSFYSDAVEQLFFIEGVFAKKLVVLATYPLSVALALIQLLIVFQIFNYRKRIRQIQTGKAIIILSIIFYLIIAAYLFYHIDSASDLDSLSIRIGFFIPLLVIILVFIANRYIKKDEDLVRSIDRIR